MSSGRNKHFSDEHRQSSSRATPQYSKQDPHIPLVCTICPNGARFSDISHLLTHVSSKGHLHNYFQLAISRETDADAAATLAEFDGWYEENDINSLLRNRKSARAQRGTHPQWRSQIAAGLLGVGRASRRGGRGGRSSLGGRGNIRATSRGRQEAEIDEIKDEPEPDTIVGASPSATLGPTLYPWQMNYDVVGYPTHLSIPSHPSEGSFQFEAEDDNNSSYEPSEGNSSYPSEVTSDIVEERTGTLMLKGTMYPGMGGFDAAFEEQRRQRNQRKDPAVLRRLKVGSEEVTTSEDVLDLNMNLQRTRDVYDEPSIDGSMDEDEGEEDAKKNIRRVNRIGARTTGQRRPNPATRQGTQASRGSRATRRSSAKDTHRIEHVKVEAMVPKSRVTRSSHGRGISSQGQLPLHNHGLHGNTDIFKDTSSDDDIREERVPSPLQARRRQNDRLSGLALRPSNANISLASPTAILKRSPSSFLPGKENNHLALKSPASSSNPYLQAANDSIEVTNYNPLYVLPRDGLAFRPFASRNEDAKCLSNAGFHPMNGSDDFNASHSSNHQNPAYHTQHNEEEYSI